MAVHSSLTGSNLHKAYAWSYADATARAAATGFVSGDIGGLAYQQDNDTLWILTATTPTWQQVDCLGTSDLYSANSILAANSADTPAAVTVAEQTIVGRITGGNITALTATQVRTLLNVEDGATADMSASEILAALLTVDGTGCLLDADKLDGLDSTDFLKLATAQTITAVHAFNPASGATAFTFGANAAGMYKSADNGYMIFGGATTALLGAACILYGSTSTGAEGVFTLRCGGADNIGKFYFQARSATATNNIAGLDYNGNWTLGGITFPGTGTNSLSVKSGTAPSTLTDNAQLYSADITAGNCAIHCQTESGAVVKLFQGAAVADATDAATTMARLNDLLARMRANGLIAT